MHPGRLARGEDLAGVERPGDPEGRAKTRAIRGRQPFGQRTKGRRATLRMKLDNRAHALFYGPHGLVLRMEAQARPCKAPHRRCAVATFARTSSLPAARAEA